MRLLAFTLVLMASLAAPGLVRADTVGPSFDCGRASAPIEHLICGSPSLSRLDRDIAAALRSRREGADEAGRAALLAEQRRWLQSRVASCAIPAKGDLPEARRPAAETCLEGLYQSRLAALAPVQAASPPAQAASPSTPPPATPPPATPPPATPPPATPPPATPPPAAPPAPTTPAAPAPAAAASLPPPPPAILARRIFPARGRNETILTVPVFGRYAIAVKSAQGTALQLVDRMAGPGDVAGIAGASDGRIDAFLDRGDYKLRLFSDPRGSGDAELSVTPSREREAEPVRLVALKPVNAALDDHEQRSWWIDVAERGVFAFEAAGRNLEELRLWRDGAWLVDAAPDASIHDPGDGKPLAVRQLSATLEPGLYRLTAYGGAGQPWTAGTSDHPFMLRWGIPWLGEADRAGHLASSFGFDRFLVPPGAREIRLELDQPAAAVLAVHAYDPAHPFQGADDSATIDKASREPLARLRLADAQGDAPWLVTIDRAAGMRYRLEVLNAPGPTASFNVKDATGDYLLATLAAASNGDDAIDPTALLLRNDQEVVAAAALELDTALPWRRHFNLIDPARLFLHSTRRLDLKVEGSGADAEFVVAPFLTKPPANYRTPAAKPSGGVWQLDPGYYVLRAAPRENGRGILTMTLSNAAGGAPPVDRGRLAAPFFPRLSLAAKTDYKLYTSGREHKAIGVALRKLPLDLAQPLSFELAAGQIVDLPVSLPEPGQVLALGEDGTALALAADGQPSAAGTLLGAGLHHLRITGPANRTGYLTLSYRREQLRPEAKLPSIATDRIRPPDLPRRPPGPPAFFDLAADETLTFAVPVERPALYRLETTGLVETAGAVRTRTNPALSAAKANGIGRNFLIQQYLREGDYQLSVEPAGKSRGRIGVAVAETPVSDQGMVEAELPARLTLAPGQAAAYGLHIAAAGRYRIRTLGLGHHFAMRLDDGEGWPLLTPGGVADAELALDPGDYRMILLPQPVTNRAVTLLHRIEPPTVREGHGPFDVAFGTELDNRWMEPEAGQPRVPDRWRFTLPAPATVTVTIGSGMLARIIGPGDPAARTATSTVPWTGELAPGSYVVEAMSASPNNLVDYSLRVDTAELLAGQKRAISAPQSLKVSLGADRQIELSSFGDTDVRARLYDAAGRLIAANDDRDNDWNFAITGRFPAGTYTLQVDPVGTEKAQTEVSLVAPEEVEEPALAFDRPARFADPRIHIVPLPEIAPGTLLLVGADSTVPVGLMLEARSAAGDWRTVDGATGLDPYLAMARDETPGRLYRARVWSVDHGALPMTLSVAAPVPAKIDEAALAAGVALGPVKLGGRELGALVATLAGPGLLAPGGAAPTLRWSAGPETGFTPDTGGTIPAPAGMLWMVDGQVHPVAARRIDLAAAPTRLTLMPGATLRLPLAPAGADRDRPVLWSAVGQGGQPGIAVAAEDAPDGAPLMAVGIEPSALGLAIALAPAGSAKPVLCLWSADASETPLPVTIERIVLSRPRHVAAGPGSLDGQIKPHEAVELGLPGGLKRLALTAPADTVAALVKAGVPQHLIRSTGMSVDIIETDADALMLLNPSSEAFRFTLSIDGIGAPGALALAPGGLLRYYSPIAAALHLAVDEGEVMPLRLAGAARRVVAVDADGRVTRGVAALAGKGSLIALEVRSGLSAVALDGPAGTAPTSDREVAPPADIPLAGPAMRLRLAAGPARLVHVETDQPIVLRDRGGQAPEVFGAGAKLNLVLGEGKAAELDVEAAGAGGLAGVARFTAAAPTPIEDGLGPKLRLPPGQSRLFSFRLPAPRTIGVGVRASVDIATCRLLTLAGEEIGRGLIHIHDLAAGTYLLAVDVPSDGVAVDIEPALVGATLPGTGPPDDVKATYLALVGDQQQK